ncbi:hypothetical protein C2845_PM01G10630 [Panicum miliaceum]|uniref:Uncharacterized protein n=1 Tax=Panicum miliaceum TaxID=4540 RepID=A0A3L6TXY9_PANMI|nr:hypothetical protein C2845_PM01G10630 [Panicum miliaceum]
MEVKVSGSGDAARGGASPTASGSKKRPPSRLQKQAPASLQLEQGAAGAGPEPGAGAGAGAWGDGRAAIPLLSPLVMSPAMPVWEADRSPGGSRREGGGEQADGRSGGEQQQQQQRGAARHGGSGERQAHDACPRSPAPAAGGGWRHPALPSPVAEPASLVPLFKSQCAVEARNAPQ